MFCRVGFSGINLKKKEVIDANFGARLGQFRLINAKECRVQYDKIRNSLSPAGYSPVLHENEHKNSHIHLPYQVSLCCDVYTTKALPPGLLNPPTLPLRHRRSPNQLSDKPIPLFIHLLWHRLTTLDIGNHLREHRVRIISDT